jgi:glyoxylase-like metal-dependent hydrolase (beta-lactamase superfamily II)/8-oxo-dGTP pyrophosphatase MutT (NUDIX family)
LATANVTQIDDKGSVVDALYAHVRQGLAATGSGAPAPAAPAVATILWRRAGDGCEVYLVQRAASLAFLGGFWSFPGGRSEPEDADRIATAVRETREEVGVSLPADPAMFAFAGRQITPEHSAVRFDTAFLMVEAPRGASPAWTASMGELSDGRWVTPADAIERWRRDEWMIAPPVMTVLRALLPGIDGAAERSVAAAEAGASAPRYWEILPGIAVSPLRTPTLPPATDTNCYLLGAGEVVIIDPGSPYESERDALERVLAELHVAGRRVVGVWLTHHHGDHVAGAAYLAERLGVPVAAHARTAELLAGRVTVDRHLHDGELIELAGDPVRRVRAVFTPGHAPGHLCFHEETSGIMVAGDMVASLGTILVDPDEGDMAAYLASLALMKRRKPRMLLPAHGGPIAAAAEKLDAYVAHRLWRETRIVEALEQRGGATPADLVPAAYADTPPLLHPLAERSLRAHLLKLAAEGRARRDGDRWQLT